MKVKIELEIEFEPVNEVEAFEALKGYAENIEEDLEYDIRHYIKDYLTTDDIDEIFVTPRIASI